MTFFVLSSALGLLLAQRFKVFVLVPTTLFVVIVAVVGDFAGAPMPWSQAMSVILGAVGLQIGYLLGLGGRALVLGAYHGPAHARGLSQRGATHWPIDGQPKEPRVFPRHRGS